MLPPPPPELSFLKETSCGCTHFWGVFVDSLALLVPSSPAAAEAGHALVGTPLVASAPVPQLCWGAAGCSGFLSHCPPAASLCSERLLECSLWGESGIGRDPFQTPSTLLPMSAPAGTGPCQARGQHSSALLRTRLGPLASLLSLEQCS